MTAIAAARPYGGRPGRAVAPATPALRRVLGTLHEPNAWTAGILLATGVALIARHPIAKALGTESDAPTVTTPVATASPHPSAAAVPALSVPLGAVPTHAPRNPFAALVTAAGQALVPSATAPTARTATAPTARTAAAPVVSPTTPTVVSGGTCTGHVHRVVRGDSLWTLAARSVHTNDIGRVTVAWHRLYAANRPTIGADPSLLLVGESLCMPSSL